MLWVISVIAVVPAALGVNSVFATAVARLAVASAIAGVFVPFVFFVVIRILLHLG